MPVFDPGVPWLRGTATLTNGSTTVETDGVITLNEILEGDRLYVMDGGERIGPLEIVGGEGDEIELREPFEGATGSYSIAIDRNPITRTGAKVLRDMSRILTTFEDQGPLIEEVEHARDEAVLAATNAGYVFETVADVQARHIPPSLDTIRTSGRLAPGDGEGSTFRRGTNVPGSIQSADGQWWEDVGYNTITVRIPSDFPTLRAAIDHYSRLPMRSGAVVDLLIESGHRLTHGLRLDDGKNYRQFRISAEDPIVYLASNFEPVISNDIAGSNQAVFCFTNGTLTPVLNCLIDGEGDVNFDGWMTIGSSSYVERECGVNGCRINGEIRSGYIYGILSNWSNAKRECLRISSGSTFDIRNSAFDYGWQAWDTEGEGGADCSLHISRGCFGQAQQIQVYQAGKGCVAVRRSYVNMILADFGTPGNKASGTGSAIYPMQGATIVLHGATMNGSPIGLGTAGVADIPAFNTPTDRGIAYYGDGTPGLDTIVERSGDSIEGYEVYGSGRVRLWKRVVLDCNLANHSVPFPAIFVSQHVYASISTHPTYLSGTGSIERTTWLGSAAVAARGSPDYTWQVRVPGGVLVDDSIAVYLTAEGYQ